VFFLVVERFGRVGDDKSAEIPSQMSSCFPNIGYCQLGSWERREEVESFYIDIFCCEAPRVTGGGNVFDFYPPGYWAYTLRFDLKASSRRSVSRKITEILYYPSWIAVMVRESQCCPFGR